jgi:hypothetical protein
MCTVTLSFYFQIARLQDRIAIVQQHMATEQCSGGPHCMLQDSMFVMPFLDPTAQVTEQGNCSAFNSMAQRSFFCLWYNTCPYSSHLGLISQREIFDCHENNAHLGVIVCIMVW